MNTTTRLMLTDEDARSSFQNYFGKWASKAERRLKDVVRAFCKEYEPYSWQFFKLSNKSFYLAPGGEETILVSIPAHSFKSYLSQDVVGLISSLLTLAYITHISFLTSPYESQTFALLYDRLLDYVEDHQESQTILKIVS